MDNSSENNTNNLKGLNPGHLVRLRSGGPYMTVKEISVNSVRCTWFNDKIIVEHVFDIRQIETRHCDDVVRLKSGGPYMTVVDRTEGHYKCIWFDKDGVFCERTIPGNSVLEGFFPEDSPNY